MATVLWELVQSAFYYLLDQLGFVKKEGKVVVVGLDNAGKTCLLSRLGNRPYQATTPTARATEERLQIGGVEIKAWDLGGHEAVRHLWSECCGDGADGIVFVVDSSDPARFDEAADELLLLLTQVNAASELRAVDPPPCAVLLNKCDLVAARPTEEVVEALDLEEVQLQLNPDPADRGLEVRHFSNCSVLRGEGYQEAFRWIASRIESL